MTEPTIITCALTGGGDTTNKSPAVPCTPKQIADQAVDAAKAGAAVVHVHVRDPNTGEPAVKFDLYADVVERIRSSGTDVMINLTTGPGSLYAAEGGSSLRQIDPMTPGERLDHVLKLKPEICSLDVATLCFGDMPMVNRPCELEQMGRILGKAGILPEIEVFDLGHVRLARHLVEKGALKSPGYFQFCLGISWGAPAQADVIYLMRSLLPPGARWSAFGISQTQFKMVAAACSAGGHVRVGLEDNLYISQGRFAASNAEQVEKAVRIVSDIGCRPATVQEARKLLLQ